MISTNSQSQIFENYPFKTLLDNNNNLYITGNKLNPHTKTFNIIVEKYDELGLSIWSVFHDNLSGPDKGLDIKVDSSGNCFVTGYKFNSLTNSNDIILISLRPDGTERWIKTYGNSGDDIGMGIEISLDENGSANDIFVSGYTTSTNTGKDFFVVNYSRNGSYLWQYTSTTPGDDVATDILLDNNFIYAIGYATESNGVNTDIKLMSFDLVSGNVRDDLVYSRPWS